MGSGSSTLVPEKGATALCRRGTLKARSNGSPGTLEGLPVAVQLLRPIRLLDEGMDLERNLPRV